MIIYYKSFVFLFMYKNHVCFFSQISGNFSLFSDSWKIIFNDKVIDSLHIFIILIDKLSYPCALVESNDFIIDNMSLSVTLKEFILVIVFHEKGGRTFAFYIGVHIDAN